MSWKHGERFGQFQMSIAKRIAIAFDFPLHPKILMDFGVSLSLIRTPKIRCDSCFVLRQKVAIAIAIAEKSRHLVHCACFLELLNGPVGLQTAPQASTS